MAMYHREESILYQKSHCFAVRIVKMVKYLFQDWKLAPIYQQILKSGTSISANVAESQFAQSPSDFITKLHIALKEANESERWLEILHDAELITDKQYESMMSDCSELIALLVSSLKTAKLNQQQIIK